MRCELVVVIGPCGAGKTTWSRRAFPDHAHPDAEELARTLFATTARFRYYPWTRAVAARLHCTAVAELLGRGVPVCVTARGATRVERAKWAALAAERGVDAHLVRLVVDEQTCVERARSDPRRPRTSRSAWGRIVAHWFRDYEPVGDGEGFVSYREVQG